MMKRLATLLSVMAMTSAVFAAETPAITIKTDIYANYGSSNHFTLLLGSTEKTYVDVDCGFGEVEYEIAPAEWDAENYSISGTPVDCTVGEDGMVRIYGDASKLNYIYAKGADITHLEMEACVNMEIVDLQHNNLQALDLSPFEKLTAVYLTDNPFTPETPLTVGASHPDLTILEVDIVEYMDPDFDIATFGNLRSFDAYANQSLTHLDPTGCPKLMRICVDSCPIKTLDVTKNPELMVLNIEDSGITEINLTNNPYLRELYANHTSGTLNTDSKISEIDLTHNSNLTQLTLAGNNLKTLDITNNPLLEYFNVSHNYLTELDLTAQTQVYEVNVSHNNMSFATLPLPQQWYGNYVYNQFPIQLDRSYMEGTTIDLSDKVLREGSETTAEVYSFDPQTATSTLLDESIYSYSDGKLTLLKEVGDSIYARFANTIFEEYPMTTSHFKVKSESAFGRPSKILSFNSELPAGSPIRMSVVLDGASEANPKTFFIDWGDGVLQQFASNGDEKKTYVKLLPGEASLYVPEGETLIGLGIYDTPLTAVNLTDATELRKLELVGTYLTGIDLKMNRCLQSLDLSGNSLTAVDLSGANGEYNKNVLSAINLSNNNISTLTLNDRRTIRHLDLSDNYLTELGMQDFDNLETFSIARNRLTEISLAYLGNAVSIDLSKNEIANVTMPEETPRLQTFDISGNKFTLATLPYFAKGMPGYVYAPQAQLSLPKQAPGVDLRTQNRVIDGKGTTFTWLLEDGSPLSAENYTCDNGSTRFLNPDAGVVYCVMSNPAFPAFTGDNVFRTTDVEVVGMPTNCIAKFVTTKEGQQVELSLAASKSSGVALYIDWNGDGTGLVQYPLTNTYTLFEATTHAGAEVKAYTYNESDRITVFSISGASMASMDASGLKDCTTFTVTGAGLDHITMPDSPKLAEINLGGNAFTSFDFRKYDRLISISMNSNKLKTVDLTGYPKLQLFHAADNGLESILFDENRNLWQLDLPNNNLKELDLGTLTSLQNLSLSDNLLTSLDLSGNPELRAVQIDRNHFTFATLPMPQEGWLFYLYANQYPLEVKCEDGKVDLSSQSKVGDVPTVYRWFVGVPEFDEDGELQGEELYVDDEYTVENGVTTFDIDINGVMCVMTNAAFPKLYLYTNLIDASASGVDMAKVAETAEEEWFDLQGRRVDPRRAGHGIYIIRKGDKTYKKTVD